MLSRTLMARRMWVVALCVGAGAPMTEAGAWARPTSGGARIAAPGTAPVLAIPPFPFPWAPPGAPPSPSSANPAGPSASTPAEIAPAPGPAVPVPAAPAPTAPAPVTPAPAEPPPAALSDAGAGPYPQSAVEPAQMSIVQPPAPVQPYRPRFNAGVGFGLSRDGTGTTGGATLNIPAFQGQLGIGEGSWAFELRLFSSQASGRQEGGVDRLALDVMLAARPFARRFAERRRWGERVARMFTLNFGLAAEHASAGQVAAWRPGLVVGGHVDLPLTAPTGGSELSARVSVRRMLGDQVTAGQVAVRDTDFEVFGGLSASF